VCHVTQCGSFEKYGGSIGSARVSENLERGTNVRVQVKKECTRVRSSRRTSTLPPSLSLSLCRKRKGVSVRGSLHARQFTDKTLVKILVSSPSHLTPGPSKGSRPPTKGVPRRCARHETLLWKTHRYLRQQHLSRGAFRSFVRALRVRVLCNIAFWDASAFVNHGMRLILLIIINRIAARVSGTFHSGTSTVVSPTASRRNFRLYGYAPSLSVIYLKHN
jgi:hypothetical protein